MCEFISAVEKDKKIYFLTADQVLGDSARAKAFREHCGNSSDYTPPGHGAIRWYYNLVGGTDREYTDFSSPANFPPEIVESIKRGEMRGLGMAEGLLNQSALAEYQRIEKPAYAEYRRIAQSAYDEYQRIEKQAYAEYERIEKPAHAEYQRIRQSSFWDLFAKPENRNPAWRQL